MNNTPTIMKSLSVYFNFFLPLLFVNAETTQATGTTIAPPDPCSPDPCHNGGICNPDMDGTGYTCDCTGTAYQGDQCANDIDECSNSNLNACDLNTNCTNTDGSYYCTCLDGFRGNGETCEGYFQVISDLAHPGLFVILKQFLGAC
ncbi:protein HEG-like [Amphiura filiformis]|uniref:protein HEG-like n=1 Tax=Amphiura filiformis TaxID=82378 RepID=UPI003B22719B